MQSEPLSARFAALFDESTLHARPGARALWARARLDGYELVCYATDPSHARGAIGVEDGEAFCEAIREASTHQLPMLWLLDSAGAKVDEGLSALAVFRRFYRAALQARHAGTRILAILGRGCYGGASLLALLAERRLYSPETRLSTSGPGIIEAVEGKARFDASDAQAVGALLGTSSRLGVDTQAECVDAASQRQAIAHWLTQSPSDLTLSARHQALRQRLAGLQLRHTDARARLQALLPPNYRAEQRGNIVYALPDIGSAKALFCGYLGRSAFGADDAWQLADLLQGIGDSHPGNPIVLLLDAAGHAARVDDERVLLADYFAHLCLCIQHLAARGHKIVLWIPGRASGAVYVVFSAGVERISVLGSARVEVLASAAVDRILGRSVAGASSAQELVDLGIAEAILDSRMEVYSAS